MNKTKPKQQQKPPPPPNQNGTLYLVYNVWGIHVYIRHSISQEWKVIKGADFVANIGVSKPFSRI